jgi:hypothetical protein
VATVPAPKSGGSIEFTLSGLPHETPVLRYLAAVLALTVAAAFLALAMKSPKDEGEKARRERLERRRQALLDQLLQQERAEAADKARDGNDGAPRKKKAGDKKHLLAELESVYRELDAPERES